MRTKVDDEKMILKCRVVDLELALYKSLVLLDEAFICNAFDDCGWDVEEHWNELVATLEETKNDWLEGTIRF